MKINKKNYFFVGTGLQVINSVEYIHNVCEIDTQNILVICNTKMTVRREVESTLNFYNWDKIIYLSPNFLLTIKPKIINFILTNFFSILKIKSLNYSEATIIGNDINYFFRYASKKMNDGNVILIDDGSGSINYKQDSPFQRLNDKKNKFLFILLGIKKYIIKPKMFFTSFAEDLKSIKELNVLENNYLYLKHKVKTYEIKNVIYFIGDPHVERGYINKDEYLLKLSILKEQFETPIIYIPRIFEHKKKLEDISQIIDVQKNIVPFELFIATSAIKPKAIIGYHSSVLFNTYKIFGTAIEYYFIKLPNYTNEIHYSNVKKLWVKLSSFAKEI